MDYRYMPFYVRGSELSGRYYQAIGDEEERDLSRLREMYPKSMTKIQELVEEECEIQEYEGSFIYDQYPDRLGLAVTVKKILDRLKREVEEEKLEDFPSDEWLKNIITVLLLSEMYCRRRKKRKKYFVI